MLSLALGVEMLNGGDGMWMSTVVTIILGKRPSFWIIIVAILVVLVGSVDGSSSVECVGGVHQGFWRLCKHSSTSRLIPPRMFIRAALVSLAFLVNIFTAFSPDRPKLTEIYVGDTQSSVTALKPVPLLAFSSIPYSPLDVLRTNDQATAISALFEGDEACNFDAVIMATQQEVIFLLCYTKRFHISIFNLLS